MSVSVRVQDRNRSPPALALEAEDNLREGGVTASLHGAEEGSG